MHSFLKKKKKKKSKPNFKTSRRWKFSPHLGRLAQGVKAASPGPPATPGWAPVSGHRSSSFCLRQPNFPTGTRPTRLFRGEASLITCKATSRNLLKSLMLLPSIFKFWEDNKNRVSLPPLSALTTIFILQEGTKARRDCALEVAGFKPGHLTLGSHSN